MFHFLLKVAETDATVTHLIIHGPHLCLVHGGECVLLSLALMSSQFVVPQVHWALECFPALVTGKLLVNVCLHMSLQF